MRVGVCGTGAVGRVITSKLAELGHEVVIGTRDVEALMARSEPDVMGNEPFARWVEKNPHVRPGNLAEAAAHGEIVVNATNGVASLDALRRAGAENLDDKVLIDIANPLDFSQGMPPSLSISDTDSLGEQIQREFPGAKVVKTLNTVNAFLMTDPTLVGDGDHTIFVSGNDDQAKAQAGEILTSFGWEHIVDLGDITTARGTEMYLPLWLRLWGALGTPMFNIKVVRAEA